MRTRSVVAASAVTFVLLASAALPSASADPGTQPATTDRYLVRTAAAPRLNSFAVRSVRRSGGSIQHVYTKALTGFSADLTAEQVRTLRSDSQVESVTPDARVQVDTAQNNPTWGLDRIDQRGVAGSSSYTYDRTGAGVTAYVVDTGVRLTHTQFGGRASSGYDFVDDDADASDCAGHGTHVAGTIGGSTYGVAKAVRIVSVRVLDCNGSGWYSDVIAGLDWVATHRSGPAVVNLSLGGGTDDGMDDAIESTIAAGIAVVVSAGNDSDDACLSSPARAPRAITVGATDVTDHRSWFSNFGSCVDIFAPGENVRSSSNDSNNTTEYLSGTSMAAPHVAGVVARYLQKHPKSTPAQTSIAIEAAATRKAVKDPEGSPNRLLYAAPKTMKPGRPTHVAARGSARRKAATPTWSARTSDGGTVAKRITALSQRQGGQPG